jgi:hypothetical protein
MQQKKRPMCTMPHENREYFVQTMPLERMNCIIGTTNLGHSTMNGVAQPHLFNTLKLVTGLAGMCLSNKLMISIYSY